MTESSRTLIRHFIDGTINEEQLSSLEIMLRSPNKARSFLRDVHFEQALSVAAKSAEQCQALTNSPVVPLTNRRRKKRTSSGVTSISLWIPLRFAALFLLLITPFALVFMSVGKSRSFAELIVHAGTVTIEQQPRTGKSTLSEDTMMQVSSDGWASLRFQDGSLFEFENDSHAHIRQADHGTDIKILAGALRASITKQTDNQRVHISGPRTQAIVLGTRLWFSVASKTDELQVFRGLVACENISTKEQVHVAGGQQVSVSQNKALTVTTITPPKTPIPPPPTAGMICWFDAKHGIKTDEQKRLAQWTDRSPHGYQLANENPHMRPVVQSGAQTYLTFSAANPYLHGTLPFPTTNAFTIAISMRSHQLGRWSQDFGWGWDCFVFHAEPNGGIFAGAGLEEKQGSGIRFFPGELDEDIPTNTMRINTWQRFVITYGNGVGAFYADGILIARKAMPPPSSRSDFSIGRKVPAEFENHGFSGDLSEFLLYDRKLESLELDAINRHLLIETTP